MELDEARHLHAVACTKAALLPSPASPLVSFCSSRMNMAIDTRTGHENMGIVEQIGDGVTLLKKGDRVVMPFNVADGRCRNCEQGKTAFCTGVNPGFAGGAYGKAKVTQRGWSV